METVLKEKQRRGQQSASGVQASRLTTKHESHSHEAQSVLRNFSLPDAGFGKRCNFNINSRNFISQIFLMVTLGDSDGSYCNNVGLKLLDRVHLRYSGRKFHEQDYSDEAFVTLHKTMCDEKLAELLRLAGGSSKSNPGQVCVPLFNYFAPLGRPDLKKGECWINTQGSARLEVELVFNEKAGLCSGSNEAITACSVYYEEVLVPVSVEGNFRGKNRVRPRIQYNSIKDIAITGGQKKEIDCSSLLAGGNIRTMWFREQTAAQRTTSTADALATARPAQVEVKINGQSLFDENQAVLDVWRLLQGQHIDSALDTPLCIPFCQNPEKIDSSGFLPASQDSMSVFYTPTVTGQLDIICEYEKIHRVSEQGRIEKSDS